MGGALRRFVSTLVNFSFILHILKGDFGCEESAEIHGRYDSKYFMTANC